MNDMCALYEQYATNVLSPIKTAFGATSTAAGYQQLNAMQKNALNAVLKAYNLPAAHMPKLQQVIDGYVKAVVSQAPVSTGAGI